MFKSTFKLALTEWDWSYISHENQDATWMSRVHLDLPINQINIPWYS